MAYTWTRNKTIEITFFSTSIFHKIGGVNWTPTFFKGASEDVPTGNKGLIYIYFLEPVGISNKKQIKVVELKPPNIHCTTQYYA